MANDWLTQFPDVMLDNFDFVSNTLLGRVLRHDFDRHDVGELGF